MVSMERIDARLRELHLELERGHRRMALLEKERTQNWETLLRINGAIQVLEELKNGEARGNTEPMSDDAGKPRVVTA